MPYIPLKENLPGITGLLDYRQDTALPIRQLTQILLRGESSLTEGERELIAAVVSIGNECRFCTAAHTAAADLYLMVKYIRLGPDGTIGHPVAAPGEVTP